MSRSSSAQSQYVIVAAAAAAAIVSYAIYQWSSTQSSSSSSDGTAASADAEQKAIQDRAARKNRDLPATPASRSTATSSQNKTKKTTEDATPVVSNTTLSNEKALHLQIENLDKKGKAFFKDQQYMKAAEVFTSALDLIDDTATRRSTSLARQVITLLNNRSAMYEKGGFPELALADCAAILEQDQGHAKARTRKLRILEAQERWDGALLEICALQLRFMQDHREQLRMGIPVRQPVSQERLEEAVAKLLPAEVEKYFERNKTMEKSLPSPFTLTQLLKSFSGYNTWMSRAAKDGPVKTLTQELEKAESAAQQASVYLKRGRRHVYDKNYEKAVQDFEDGYALVEDSAEQQEAMENDDFCRLMEWVGMVRHWKYDLEGSLKCYEKCCDLEPENAFLLVKRAGVHMDGGKHDEALKLFDMALGLDPALADALMHRANLRMLQQKVEDAKGDLLECLRIRPNHLQARLRLATVFMAVNDLNGAKTQLDKAEQFEPNSSEVYSYRGEMYFAQGDLAEAKTAFDKAIRCEASNPTPYVNSALAIMNTPSPTGGPPDAKAAIELLEKGIQVDPQFHAAYMHLGQLKLALATDLVAAKKVVALYDTALTHCRTREELKEICGVRLLTVAQVEAATMLGMESFSMQ